MNGPWFLYSLLATLFYGIINFTYKVVARNGYSSLKILNIQALTVAAIALIFTGLFSHSGEIFRWILIFALLNSFFFAMGTILKMSALKYIPVNVAVPIGKLNSVFVIFIGIIFFAETPTPVQTLGIILAMTAVFMLIRPQDKELDARALHLKGVLFVVLGALSVSVSITVGKLASERVPNIDYVFFSYLFVAVYTFLTGRYIMGYKNGKRALDSRGYLLGFILGALNISGYLLILRAWATGPLSLVQAVFSLAMIISIVLARIFYKEKFTPRNISAVFISLIAVYLIKG